MKKHFNSPELTISRFYTENIITTSGTPLTGNTATDVMKHNNMPSVNVENIRITDWLTL